MMTAFLPSLASAFEVAGQTGFHPGLDFYLSSAGFLIGTFGGIYLLIEYFKHGRSCRFLLLWLIGMALVYWFRIPTMFANAGAQVVLDSFDTFLAVAFPASLLGFFLMLFGVQSIHRSLARRGILSLSAFWLISAIAFFLALFLENKFTSYLPAIMTNLVFFVPVRAAILYSLWQWYLGWKATATAPSKAGILFLMGGMFLGICQHLLALRQMLLYPPDLWFVALQSSVALFILEASATFCLFLGVFMVHKECLRRQALDSLKS